jgi:hypothetical protein
LEDETLSMTKLTSREKNLLGLCFGVLLIMASMILLDAFLKRRAAVLQTLAGLERELQENKSWLADEAYWKKHGVWVEANLPRTESLGRAQGQLLEEVQNDALDLQLRVERQTLLEPVTAAHYREVSVNVRLAGDQNVILQYLAGLQSPERFQVIKQLEFEVDTRSRAAKPQARCDLVLARWFALTGG